MPQVTQCQHFMCYGVHTRLVACWVPSCIHSDGTAALHQRQLGLEAEEESRKGHQPRKGIELLSVQRQRVTVRGAQHSHGLCKALSKHLLLMSSQTSLRGLLGNLRGSATFCRGSTGFSYYLGGCEISIGCTPKGAYSPRGVLGTFWKPPSQNPF